MPRPRKAGLDYFYKGVHEWDDIGMSELMQKYGPMGYCIYEVVLCKVYESGYYLEISLDRLAGYVIKTVGNRWVREKSIVLQVIRYCAEIGLFDDALLQQSVITSASIQQHYSEVTARSKADKSKYWLLGETKKKRRPAERDALPVKEESAAKTEFSPAKTPESAAKTPQSKENKTKQKQSKEKQSNAAAASPRSEVEEAYTAATGREFRRSDTAALEEIRSFGAEDWQIIRVIEEVAKRGNNEIASMRYYLPIVREYVKNSRDAPQDNSINRQRGLSPETSRTEEVELVLDEEWLAQISSYEPMPDEDYS